ncbi:hypothetical protein HOY82DRAFT_572275, partial [Tuber indicum]
MKGRGKCEYGGTESRDHILIHCLEWEGIRKEVWKGWWRGIWEKEGWVEMDRLLFGEEGTKRVIEFGRKTKWIERNRRIGRIADGEERKGMLIQTWRENWGGWRKERTEERRREMLRDARERMKRLRERRRLESARLNNQMVPSTSIMGLLSTGRE